MSAADRLWLARTVRPLRFREPDRSDLVLPTGTVAAVLAFESYRTDRPRGFGRWGAEEPELRPPGDRWRFTLERAARLGSLFRWPESVVVGLAVRGRARFLRPGPDVGLVLSDRPRAVPVFSPTGREVGAADVAASVPAGGVLADLAGRTLLTGGRLPEVLLVGGAVCRWTEPVLGRRSGVLGVGPVTPPAGLLALLVERVDRVTLAGPPTWTEAVAELLRAQGRPVEVAPC